MGSLEELRAEADALRAVSAAPASRGLTSRLAKAAEPLARAQRSFNDAMLRLVDALSERIDAASSRAGEAERRSRELEERVLRLERRPGAAAATVAAQPGQDAIPDYFAFEARMRAPSDEIRKRQQPYAELLAGHAPVLDLGCGRGELLELLRAEGIEARGVDADGDMVAFAAGEGLDVEQGDASAALAAVPAGSLGAVTALQLVEHLPPRSLVRLLELAAAGLRPGGLLVLETINPVSPRALQHYFSDLTHAQPLVAGTLELLVRSAGFGEVEVRYLNPPEERIGEVDLPAGQEWDGARAALAANARLLNETLFAPLDYAIVAHR